MPKVVFSYNMYGAIELEVSELEAKLITKCNQSELAEILTEKFKFAELVHNLDDGGEWVTDVVVEQIGPS